MNEEQLISLSKAYQALFLEYIRAVSVLEAYCPDIARTFNQRYESQLVRLGGEEE